MKTVLRRQISAKTSVRLIRFSNSFTVFSLLDEFQYGQESGRLSEGRPFVLAWELHLLQDCYQGKHKDACGISCPAVTERRSQLTWLLVCIKKEFKLLVMLEIGANQSYAEEREYIVTEAEIEYSRLFGFFPNPVDFILPEAFIFSIIKDKRDCVV